MAIGFLALGTQGESITDPATSPGVPAGDAAGVLLLLAVGSKAATPPTCSTPTDWSAESNNTITGGAGSAGANTGGPVRITGFWLESGGATGAPAIDLSAAASPTCAGIAGFTKGAGESWVTPTFAVAADSAGSTTEYDPTAAAQVLDLQAGDWLVIVSFVNDDAGTPTLPGSVTATGITFGTVVNRMNDLTTTGNDARMVLDTVPVNSGTASGGPDYTFTIASAIANFAGASFFVRLRVTAAPVTGTATGTHGYTGSVAGLVDHTGQAAGSHAYAGSVAGVRGVTGQATGSHTYVGTASGSSASGVTGTAVGSHGYAGTATGVRNVAGTAVGSHGFTGTATGVRDVAGTATGSHGHAGTAAGVVGHVGTAVGSHAYAGTVSGVRGTTGVAAGSHGYSGAAAGVGAPPFVPALVGIETGGSASSVLDGSASASHAEGDGALYHGSVD